MNCFGESACLALTLAGIVGAAAADEDQAQAGREVFDQRCRNCHGGSLVGNGCDLLIPATDWLPLLLKSD